MLLQADPETERGSTVHEPSSDGRGAEPPAQEPYREHQAQHMRHSLLAFQAQGGHQVCRLCCSRSYNRAQAYKNQHDSRPCEKKEDHGEAGYHTGDA